MLRVLCSALLLRAWFRGRPSASSDPQAGRAEFDRKFRAAITAHQLAAGAVTEPRLIGAPRG